MSTYQIVELPASATGGFCPRGGAIQLWQCKAPEAMLSGPAETGKTYSALKKLDALAWKYPGAQLAMVRKTYNSMAGTVLQIWTKKILGPDSPVQPFGGEHPQWFDYPNRSRVWVGGLDNPVKVLSGERDAVYVNQAEELSTDDWEVLTTRTTGRAGNMPYAQVFGDCNPDVPTHWIVNRPSLKVFESRHEDNPVLFDEAGAITEQGRRSLAVLDALTGVRKQRYRYGRWVGAEGQVYEFDKAVHLIDRMPDGWEHWRKIRSIDFGFTNPFVCQWWAIDGDGRMYLYREMYMSGRTVATHLPTINAQTANEYIEATVSDHDAEDRATLAEGVKGDHGEIREPGIATVAAYKAVSRGIQAVEDRLKVAADGKPRIFILRDALVEVDEVLRAKHKPLTTEAEFPSYVWQKSVNGRPIKEEPLKVDDHGMDTMRYAVAYVDGLRDEEPDATNSGVFLPEFFAVGRTAR
jgi:PBSX family phage terminase large subunit